MAKVSHSNPELDNVLGMETIRHTPLPWMRTGWRGTDAIKIGNEKHEAVCFVRKNTISDDCEESPSDRDKKALCEANADFIVKAANCHNDLLNALTALEAMCTVAGWKDQPCLERARKAISKAQEKVGE